MREKYRNLVEVLKSRSSALRKKIQERFLGSGLRIDTKRDSSQSRPLSEFSADTEVIKIPVSVIDESSDNNPFSNNPAITTPFVEQSKNWFSRESLSPESTEGFHHNEAAQFAIGTSLAELFGLNKQSHILEFGCGGNYAISSGIKSDTGSENIYLLDHIVSRSANTQDLPYKSDHSTDVGIPLFSGDFSQSLSEGSELKNKRGTIDFIMVNGALFSGGHNFTVEEIGESLYYQTPEIHHDDREAVEKFVENYIKSIFMTAKDLLKVGGSFFISSSRYANHGAGFSELQLGTEKKKFLHYIILLQNLGAKKITLFGVTLDGIQANIEHNIGLSSDDPRRQRLAFLETFVNVFFPPFKILNANKIALTREELLAVANDPELFEELMQDEKIRNEVNLTLESRNNQLDSVISDLSEPLPGFPENIARIDAIGVQF